MDDREYRHADEETFAELAARAEAALALLAEHPAARICVVTHGGFLRVLVGVMVFGSDFSKKEFVSMLQHLLMTNTGITHATFDEAYGWRLITWNDQSHLG